jgi:hypothetical protein
VTRQQFRQRPAVGAPSPPLTAWPGWVPPAGLCLVCAAGLALFLVPLGGVDLGRMNGLGLVSVLPAASLTGAGLLTVAFVAALGLARPYPAVLAAMLAAIVVCFDGITAVVAARPGQATAYQAAGIAQYIAAAGHPPPGAGPYSGWPGFFALIAFAGDELGTRGLITVLRWWPAVMSLLWLLPLFLLIRNMRASWQARWFAAFLFCVGNWAGPSFFSPESYGYLLYLLFLAILLTWFRTAPGTLRPRSRRAGGQGRRRWRGAGLLSGELPYVPVSPGQQAILLGLLLAIFAVATVSYPLAAFLLAAACLVLALARRSVLTSLPVLLFVTLAGWFSFVAAPGWAGRLLANVRSLASAGGGTAPGISDAAANVHVRALETGLLIAVIIIGLAVAGRRQRRTRFLDDRCMLVLACTPILAFAIGLNQASLAQAYLFALPALSMLAAYLFFPATQPSRASWPVVSAAAACALVLTGAFFVARYASASFEQVRSGDLKAMAYVYAHDSRGARLLWPSSPAAGTVPALPWQYRGLGKVDYIPVQAPPDPGDVGHVVAAIRRSGPGTYLVITRSQVAQLQQAANYPAGWGQRFREQMSVTPGIRMPFADGGAAVYTLHWPPRTPRKPLPAAPAAIPRPSARLWTAAGLAVWALLVIVLAVREFMEVRHPRRDAAAAG